MYFLIFSLNENGKNLCGESPRNFGRFYTNCRHCQFEIHFAKLIENIEIFANRIQKINYL